MAARLWLPFCQCVPAVIQSTITRKENLRQQSAQAAVEIDAERLAHYGPNSLPVGFCPASSFPHCLPP